MQKLQIYSKLHQKNLTSSNFFKKIVPKFPKKQREVMYFFKFFYQNIMRTLIGNTYIVKIVETIEK
jgi:hypothetical protein